MALLDEYIDNGYDDGFDDTPGFLRNPEENADFLLRGLTRAGQDAMARDVFGRLSKKASRHKAFRSDKIDPEGGFVVKVGSEPAYNGGEDIFQESIPPKYIDEVYTENGEWKDPWSFLEEYECDPRVDCDEWYDAISQYLDEDGEWDWNKLRKMNKKMGR